MADPRDRMSPSFSFGPVRRGRSAPRVPVPPVPCDAADAGSPSSPTAAPGSFRQWAGASKATLAVVFTDVVSSSLLGAKLGNRAMDQLRRAHFAHTEALIAAHDGFLVKTIGDSAMAAFRAASDALDFALAVRADPGDRRLQLRVGVHVGPVTVETHDVYGATVNYAARVVGGPPDAAIWLSSEAKSHVDQERAPHHGGLTWRRHDGLVLKGFAGKHVLWSVARA